MIRRAAVRPRSRVGDSAIRSDRGAALIEAMVGLVMMTMILLSIGQAMALAMRTTVASREDVRLWADVQGKADSLLRVGASNAVSGADSVGWRSITWTVSGSNPVAVDLVAARQRITDRGISSHHLFLYLRD